MTVSAVILAAGLGKRMKSSLPKVLHEACGKPLVRWVADAARAAGAEQLVAVVGPEMTEEEKARHLGGFSIAIQRDRLGTGHATMQAMPMLAPDVDEVVVLCGDVPCLRAATVADLIESRRRSGAGAAVLTMILDDPSGYGRMIRSGSPGADGRPPVTAIVEDRDATPAQKAVNEVNSGTYAFRRTDLEAGLATLSNANAQGEYYLTDVVRFCAESGRGVVGVVADDPDEMRGVNTPDQLAGIEQILASRIAAS